MSLRTVFCLDKGGAANNIILLENDGLPMILMYVVEGTANNSGPYSQHLFLFVMY
jgi:hypothetical protein